MQLRFTHCLGLSLVMMSAAGCEPSIDKQRQSVVDLECLTENEQYAAYWQNDTAGAMIANELRLIRGGGECPPRFPHQETKQ